jgi:hypothetical protein
MEKIVYYSPGMERFGQNVERIYGFKRYSPLMDKDQHVFFQSLYFDEDYYTLENHRGSKHIFWNGSDVLRMLHNPAWKHIITQTPAKHSCQSKQLQDELQQADINATIRPVFFSDISKYKPSYKQSDKPHLYMVSHPQRDAEYGVEVIKRIALDMPDFTFHIYGNNGESTSNVIYHGDVDEDIMDLEIANMQGCIRINAHDGFSQTLIKSILMAQYPVSYLPIEGVTNVPTEARLIQELNAIKTYNKPNDKLRNLYLPQLKNLNWALR